jgi:endonuclease/exonuclease/phosphatase (EEP) superfamily protein YafD
VVRWAEATYEHVEPDAPVIDIDEPRRRRRGGRRLGFVVWVLGLVFVAYTVVRVLSLETAAFLVGAMAVTPYAAAIGLLLTLVTVGVGRRLLAVVLLVATLALGALMTPRILSEEQPQARGDHLRIMAANLRLGHGDARTIVDLVRRQQVDVLALPELTPAAESALDSAGLADALPYRVFDARPGGDGSGIAANVPLRQIVLVEESILSQPSVVLDRPGKEDLELTAVHIQPPLAAEDVDTWRRELNQLPRPTPRDRVRILAGDFNASLDHSAFRNVVDHGYADAGEETGEGMTPTWADWPLGPPLTIDHILADDRCAISSYAVFDVPGSDHNAVMAEIVLP